MRAALIPGVLAMVVAGCSTTRVAPLDDPEAKLAADEIEIWEAADRITERLESGGRVYGERDAQAYLQSVVDRLLATRPQAPPRPVTVRILASPDTNAFMLANGDLYITTGLLALVESESELATILGHETVHFLNRHSLKEARDAGNRRAGKAVFNVLVMAIGAALGGQQGAEAFGNLADSAASQWNLAAISGYSQALETEADNGGFAMMVAGGFDSRRAPLVFEHLIAALDASGEQEPYYYATHPRLAERLANYQALLAAREPAPPAAPAETEPYTRYRAGFLREDAALNLEDRQYDRARAEVTILERLVPPDGTTRFLAAEIERRAGGAAGADRALELYREAVGLAAPPPDAFRELGLALRSRGDPSHAQYLSSYLALAPQAVDAPLIRRYLEESSPPDTGAANEETPP